MDGFTDSLSERFKTPQDMINANSQADAEEIKSLQDQVEKYEGVLEKINETVDTLDKKLLETAGTLNKKLNATAGSLDKKIDEIKPAPVVKADTEEFSTKLSGVEGKLQEHIHKENVRVYRNVQASVVDELDKQTKTLAEQLTAMDDKLSRIYEAVFILTEEQKANNATLLEKLAKIKRGKANVGLQIVVLIAALADLAFNLLRYFGIL